MKEPLAQRLRPRTLDEVCGQRHLLAPGQVFRRTIDRGVIPNMIFYGPSGVGKTTVASIIAANSGMRLYKLNGTTASTSDIKSVLGDIGTLNAANGILLYLDEIQYFNKRQQQSLLECVEQGTVTLIASTTENPYFYVYNALLSRCTVFEFKSLTAEDIAEGVKHAAQRYAGQHPGRCAGIPGPKRGRRYAQGAGQPGICRQRSPRAGWHAAGYAGNGHAGGPAYRHAIR